MARILDEGLIAAIRREAGGGPMKRISFVLSLLVILGLLGSCGRGNTAANLPAGTQTPDLTATVSPSPLPSFTPSPSSTPVHTCPAVVPGVAFTAPQDNSKVVDSLLAYLNAGGDPGHPLNLQHYYAVVTDLNGDGLNEVVVTGSIELGEQVHIFIFVCGNGIYTTAASFEPEHSSGAPILAVEPLLAKYPPQVIIEIVSMGWTSDIQAIGWDGQKWHIFFTYGGGCLPEFVPFGLDDYGNKKISVISDVGCSYQSIRKILENYEWNGEEYVLTSSQFTPGYYRVDYLSDAEFALGNGDVALAIVDYDRAAHDPTLIDLPSEHENTEYERMQAGKYQISFALFRTATLWFSINRPDVASRTIDELEENYPPKTPGNEFTQAIIIFRDQMSQGNTPIRACQAVTDFFKVSYPGIIDHIGKWGTRILILSYYDIDELCPFH